MTKIVAISDTHGMYRELDIPEGDILIHSGDILGQGTLDNLEDFNAWLRTLPHKHKVIIAGNHDWCFQDFPEESREMLTNGVYLEDESAIVEGIKIYGSPWQPRFFDWAFNLNRGPAIREKWDLIPDDTEILLTHGPAWSILDQTTSEYAIRNVGCQDLFDALERVKPKLHVFGHIHEGYGHQVVDNTLCVNASVNTKRYRPNNPPIVINVEEEAGGRTYKVEDE